MNHLQKYEQFGIIPTEIATKFPPELQKEASKLAFNIANTDDWRAISDMIYALADATLKFADDKTGFPVSNFELADLRTDLKNKANAGTYQSIRNEEFQDV